LGGIAVFDELGFVGFGFVELRFVEVGPVGLGLVEVGLGELFTASRVVNRFVASPANSPSGYFFKYSLKSSGFALSLMEFQKIISAAAALSLVDFAGRLDLVLLAGVLLFVVVVFFGVAVGFATTSPPLPCGVPTEALGFDERVIRSSITAIEIRRVTSRVLNLKQSVFIASPPTTHLPCY